VRYPCSVCHKSTGKDLTIQCRSCGCWVHARCSGIIPPSLGVLKQRHGEGWDCPSCPQTAQTVSRPSTSQAKASAQITSASVPVPTTSAQGVHSNNIRVSTPKCTSSSKTFLHVQSSAGTSAAGVAPHVVGTRSSARVRDRCAVTVPAPEPARNCEQTLGASRPGRVRKDKN
jgi:hypothetical protein